MLSGGSRAGTFSLEDSPARGSPTNYFQVLLDVDAAPNAFNRRHHLPMGSVNRPTNEIIIDGTTSLETYIARLNRLSTLEADARTSETAMTGASTPARVLRGFRPAAVFLRTLTERSGARSGPGRLENAVFGAWHHLCIDLKSRCTSEDLERPASAGLPPPLPKKLRPVVCILTLNEERHIAGAISSAKSITDQVVVVDSFSNDATTATAVQAGAVVWQNKFDGWGAQRNWALDRIQQEFGDRWVFFLDADERLGNELVDEIACRLPDDAGRYSVYLIGHTVVFAGRPLRFGGFSGTQWARLLRASAGRHEDRPVNDHLILPNRTSVARLEGRVLHDDVGDWSRYIDKQNRYSTLEAREVLRRGAGTRSVTLREAIANPPMRRRWLRENVWPSIPAKPLARWIQIYLLSGGIFDGYAGFAIATMQAWQEMCIELKSVEMGAVESQA